MKQKLKGQQKSETKSQIFEKINKINNFQLNSSRKKEIMKEETLHGTRKLQRIVGTSMNNYTPKKIGQEMNFLETQPTKIEL